MPQGVEGKVPDVGILQQAVVIILEGFLLKVVSKLVGDDEAIIGVLKTRLPKTVAIMARIQVHTSPGVNHCGFTSVEKVQISDIGFLD